METVTHSEKHMEVKYFSSPMPYGSAPWSVFMEQVPQDDPRQKISQMYLGNTETYNLLLEIHSTHSNMAKVFRCP